MKKTPIVMSSEMARKKYNDNMMMLEKMESMFGGKKEEPKRDNKGKENGERHKEKHGTE
jgi:hypothetical protein